MHSMQSYILLYMYVGRSQEVDKINMHHIKYMYLTLCYKAGPACKFRKKLIFFLNSLPQFFISKLTFLSTNITLSILSILAVCGDACHMHFILDLAHCRVSVAQWQSFFLKNYYVSMQGGMLLASITSPHLGLYLTLIRFPHMGMYLAPIRLLHYGIILHQSYHSIWISCTSHGVWELFPWK